MTPRKPRITVVGSFNFDLVIKTERRPQKGETLIGQSFGMFVGGKGFNQAVAAARLGAQVSMVGKLGVDYFGERFLQALKVEGIDSSHVYQDETSHTGVGTPVIDSHGDNSIIIVPGANLKLTPADVDEAANLIQQADMLMLQLEVSLDATLRAAEIAHQAGVPVMLNPAPAQKLPESLLKCVSCLTPNETEAQILTGTSVADDASAAQAARYLLEHGVGMVVVTLGERGSLVADGKTVRRVPAYPVKVVDTTAAGDAFCAGLAVQLAQKQPPDAALRFANAAGALATTVMGAEPSMPHLAELLDFLAAQKTPQTVTI